MVEHGSCRVSFPNLMGVNLCGHLEVPRNSEVRAYAVFSHCFTCNKNYKAPVYLGRALAKHGIATLRYDFPGLGGSEGDFSRTTLTDNIEDVISAARYLAEEYEAPRVLIGHSMGGAATLFAASEIDSAELVVTLAAPSQPGVLGPRLIKTREQALQEGIGTLTIEGKAYRLGRAFFDDLQRHDLEQTVHSLEKSLLVVHSPTDDVVPFSSAKALIDWAYPPKELLRLEGADHLFSREEDIEQIARAITVRLK